MKKRSRHLLNYAIAVLFILVILFLGVSKINYSGLALLSGEDVAVTRDLSDFQQANQEFTVTLQIETRNNITSIGIDEYFPSDWQITSIDCSTLRGEYCLNSSNKIEILLFKDPLVSGLEDTYITYNVLPNSDTGTFSGTWESIDPDSTGSIRGDSDIGGGQVIDDFDGDGIEDSIDNCPYDSNTLQADEDGDNVGDSCDRCLGTSPVSILNVNRYGCVFPDYSKFSSSLTTNFIDSPNLRNLPNLTLGIEGKGMIVFFNKLINSENLDFDTYVHINDRLIGVDSKILTSLNKTARLQFYNINFISPKTVFNGIECSGCREISYVGKNFTVEVPHFSNYSIEEGYVSSSSDDGGGSGGGGATGGGTDSCVANWDCTGWTICKDNIKTRTCIDAKNCSNPSDKPVETQYCSCVEEWVCDDWALCKKEKQTRDCIDSSGCGAIFDKPETEKKCSLEPKKAGILPIFYIIAGILILAALIIVVLIIRHFRKKMEFISPPLQ